MPNLDGFYDARVARDIAIGITASSGDTVLREINALQIAVSNSVTSNGLEVEIGSGTTAGITDMTTNVGQDYYTAWAEPSSVDPDSSLFDPGARVARERMNRVIQYFTRLGYAIERERNGTMNEFIWRIRW